MTDSSQFNTDRTYPGRWTITFSNPPINMFVPTTIVELGALMTDLEADPSVKVVVFQSANPDFFIAHLDVSKAAERPEAPQSLAGNLRHFGPQGAGFGRQSLLAIFQFPFSRG
jgi:enoyl-CoA hydratase/carnithine racemase